MLTDVGMLLERLGERAGWARGEIRTRLFRHTCCAARMQTLDAGAAVSIDTVARELGHQTDEKERRVYSTGWAIGCGSWGLLLGTLLTEGHFSTGNPRRHESASGG
jgi:hypothetical protein